MKNESERINSIAEKFASLLSSNDEIQNLIFDPSSEVEGNEGHVLVEGTFGGLFDDGRFDEESSLRILGNDVLFIRSFVRDVRKLSGGWLGSVELVEPRSGYDFALKFNFVDKFDDIDEVFIVKALE